MKIMIITDMTGGPGGAYKYIEQISNHLSGENEVLCVFEENTRNYITDNYNFSNCSFGKISHKFHEIEKIKNYILEILNEKQPDIIHLVNGSIKSNLEIRKFLNQKNIRFIVTEQYIDECLDLASEKLKEIQAINENTFWRIYVSESNYNIAVNKFGITMQKNFSIIHNAITPSNHKMENYPLAPRNIFMLARCVEQKGIDTAIKAISLISEYKLNLDIFGDGEKNEEYKSLADKILSDNHKFKILGWQRTINFQEITQKYDLYLSASRQEGLSYSLLEIGTVGIPSICSLASGTKEYAVITDACETFNVDDHYELSRKINSYFKNPEKLNTQAENGARRVDLNFNINTKIGELLEVYKKLI